MKIWLGFVLLACAGGHEPIEAAVPAAVENALRARAASQGEVRLIVQFEAPGKGYAELPASGRAARQAQIAQLQTALASRIQQPGLREVTRFRTIPFMVFAADAAGVARLARHPDITGLQEDIPEFPLLASSIPVIGAQNAWTAGYDGAGQAIVVLDTGVATTHPYFPAPKLLAEACFSTNDSVTDNNGVTTHWTSLCPAKASSSTAAGSGLHCSTSNVSPNCSHGTHVAGIAAGNKGTGPNIGVARGAGLVAIQVFTCRSSQVNCTGLPDIISFVSDQVRALEHVLTLSATYSIAAVNMSLGSFTVYSNQVSCDVLNGARKAAIDNLRAVGIATVVAAGNSSSKTGLSQPGCISSVISVGNTTDADEIAPSSNVSSYLSLLAPGTDIVSAFPGGLEVSSTGTSMSSPHVAGAFAVLRQAAPAASVNELLLALRDTGTLVNDQRTDGIVTGMRRINLDAALELVAGPQPEIETNPVAGSMIDLGDVPVSSMGSTGNIAVSNTGASSLELSCGISGAQAGNFTVLACPASIAAASNSSITLRCDPASTGELVATLTINTNDVSEPVLNFSLQCTGLGVEIATTPVAGMPLNFGGVLYDTQSNTLSVQVSNLGNQPLSLACSLAGADPGQFEITACTASVTGGAQTQVSVRCAPDGQASYSATLELSSNDPDESLLEFPLNCAGLAPEIATDPGAGGTVDFAGVAIDRTSAISTVNVANSGDGLLTLECDLGGTSPGSFIIVQCPASVAADNAADVELRCQPQAMELLQAQLQISSNDMDEALLQFELQCEGLPPEDVFNDGFETTGN